MQNPYAGFWLRAVAFVIDGVIISIPVFIINFLLGVGLAIGTSGNENAAAFAMIGATMLSQILYALIFWLYYALFESSAKQATLGKQIMGIKVTDMNGQRISFGRATGRTLGMFVSAIILYIGYLMAGTTARKQGLHDIMAGALVVRKDVQPGQDLPAGKSHPLGLAGLAVLMLASIILPIVLFIGMVSKIADMDSNGASGFAGKMQFFTASAQLLDMQMNPDPQRQPITTPEFNYFYNIDGLRAVHKTAPEYTIYLPQGSNDLCCESGECEQLPVPACQ